MQPPPFEGYVSTIDLVVWAAVAVGFLIMHWRINNLQATFTDLLNSFWRRTPMPNETESREPE